MIIQQTVSAFDRFSCSLQSRLHSTLLAPDWWENLFTEPQPTNKISPLVRVIFLTENHENKHDRARNMAFLKENYSFTRGDMILVEDDSSKPPRELNLEQIPEALPPDLHNIEGWDSHESCVRRKKVKESINKILSAVSRLEEMENEDDIYFLNETMKRAGSKDKLFCRLDTATEKAKFLTDCKGYAEQVRGYSTWKEFPERQESLQHKIHACLSKPCSGILFVFTGKLHVDQNNEKTASFVKNLLSSLNQDSYMIVEAPPSFFSTLIPTLMAV